MSAWLWAGPWDDLAPKGAPNTMGGHSHSRTYLHLCLHSPYLTCQDPVFSQEQTALGPLAVIGAVIIGRCLQQQVSAAKGRFPACKSWKVRPCRTVWGSLRSDPGRRPHEKPAALAFDLSSLRNEPESPAEGEGSCQATRLVKSRAGTQACSYLANSRL